METNKTNKDEDLQAEDKQNLSIGSDLPVEDLFLDGRSNVVKIPLAKKGSWKHPRYGTLSFSDEDFETLENNFKNNSLGFKPYITFGHLDEEHDSTDSHRKRGELLNYSKQGDTLYGVFEAKPEAVEEIKAGNYEFASGEFIRSFSDKTTGEEKGIVLERVALTNSPFLPFNEEEKASVISLSNSYSCFKLSMNEATTAPIEFIAAVPSPVVSEEVNLNEEANSEEKVLAEESSITLDSVETTESTDKDNQPIYKEEDMTVSDQQIEETKEAPIANEVVEPTSVEEPVIKASVEPQPDIQTIINAAIATVKSEYETKFDSLKSELETQQKLSNQFTERLAHEEKVALSQSLTAMGVPPATVERLHVIRQALSNNSKSIKLSQNGDEVEVDLFKAITQLVTDSLGIKAVDESQHGASRGQTNDFIESIKAITERNKQLVQAK